MTCAVAIRRSRRRRRDRGPGSAGPSAYWYLARGTGAVALVLLTVSVVLGILGSLRFAPAPRWPRFAIDTLHRDVSLLVLVLLVVHIITSVLDSFAPIRLIDAVIPFVASYRPLWLGLGALSFDLLIALVVTSLAAAPARLPRAGARSTGSPTRAGRSPCSTASAPAATRRCGGCSRSRPAASPRS